MVSERTLFALSVLLVLSACGVEGPPLPPEPREEPERGTIILSGEAAAGVVGRS